MCFGNVYTLNQRFRWWICCLCQQELDSHGETIYYVNYMVVARRIRLIYVQTSDGVRLMACSMGAY